MDATIEKYLYLGKKTDALLRSANTVALVYHGTAGEESWAELLQTLSARYNKDIPVFNIIELDQKASQLKGIYTAFIDDNHSPKKGQPTEWQGWDESWHDAFVSFNCF
jgi:hypothetical protein